MERHSSERKSRAPKAPDAKRGFIGTVTSKGGMVATLVSVAALGLTAATTLGVTSFSAQVGGTGTFQSGTLLLSDTNGSGTCLSSANSAGSISTNINVACAGSDLGASTTQEPSAVAQTSNVTLTNQGSIASVAGLTLVTGACTATHAPFAASVLDPLASGTDTAGFCGQVLVTVFSTTAGNCLFPAGAGACPALLKANGTLATLQNNAGLSLAASLAVGASVAIVIKTELDNVTADPGASNADQGLVASMPMTYTLLQ